MEIARITGRPKSSVYFHIRNIPLSPRKYQKIHALNIQHLLRVARSRKGKSIREFKKIYRWNPENVSLVAHLLFDGEIKRSGCVYNNRNKILLKKVEVSMKKMYRFSPTRYYNPNTGVSRISYFNVALGNYMEQKAKELWQCLGELPLETKRSFLRAFFDDEGCIDFRPKTNSRRIRGYQKDIAILEHVSQALRNFGITSRIQKPNEVVITGRNNLIMFQKEIGFTAGVYINGNRSNSIWKKHLEKREILARAIHSYIKV
ncbi:LAGLIDADG family homing endonuclease [Patescibacteria group bacterium]|nr:LAGLIDADG family homing endonuclease [Patescibacteria group bacterium]